MEGKELVFNIMGETTTNYGVIADMEALIILLDHTVREYTSLRDSWSTTRQDNEKRAERNTPLETRTEGTKYDVQGTIGGLLDNLNMIDGIDILFKRNIIQYSFDADHNFDSNGN